MKNFLTTGLFTILCCSSIATAMSFKKALLGQRDIQGEIEAVKTNPPLESLDAKGLMNRFGKLSDLYTQLRNKQPDKGEAYQEYHVLAQNYRQAMQDLERMAHWDNQEQKITENVIRWHMAHINAITGQPGQSHPERMARIAKAIPHYEALEQLDLQKSAEHAQMLLKLYAHHRYHQLEDIVQRTQPPLSAKEMSECYRELSHIAPRPDRKTECEILANLHAREHEGQQQALQEKAAQTEKQKQLRMRKVCHIVGITAEITKINSDAKLSPFQRLDQLATLLSQRSALTKGMPEYEKEYAGDAARARSLRLQSVPLAPTAQVRAMILNNLQS